jgi:hypothetical protein
MNARGIGGSCPGQIKGYYHILEELRRNTKYLSLCATSCIISTPNYMKIHSHLLSAGRCDRWTDKKDAPVRCSPLFSSPLEGGVGQTQAWMPAVMLAYYVFLR